MRAVRPDRKNVIAASVHNDADIGYLHPLWPTVQLRQWDGRRPVRHAQSGSGLVDPGARSVHQRGPEIAAAQGESVSKRAADDPASMAASAAVAPGHHI